MLGILKRGLAVLSLSLVLAACQVVPSSGPVTTTGPVGPSDTALPGDDGRHRIALLVPLSGSNAEVGQSIANATTMALLDTNANNLRITTYDTNAGAADAATRAVADGNKLILGPLMRENVDPIAARARPAGIPLISFSNDLSVAAPDIYVMGHAPEQSVARTIAYARSRGARRFAALIPDGEYGKRTSAALSQAAAAAGASVTSIEPYNRGNTSIVSAAERLKARGGFDAVLIADGARLSAMAAAVLKTAEPVPMILGTELWSGESRIASSAAVRGGMFSTVSDGRFRQFSTSYESRFGGQPSRIATLGYDAVLLTLRIARDWTPGSNFPTGKMLASDGFLGLDGPFRFHSNGTGERAMEVRQVGNDSVTVIDAAPARFD